MKEKFFTTKKLTVTAVMTAISYLLYMFVKFPLPALFPSFLDVQISELPAMLTGFMAGPFWGCAVILFKCLLKLPFTTTAAVGELGDLLMGIAYVLPSSLLYYRKRTKKNAVLGLILGSVCEIAVAVLTNGLILIPFYSKAFGWDALVNMLSSLFKGISKKSFYTYYLPLSVLPFNLLRMTVCSLITFFTYKHLHRLIDKMFLPRHSRKHVAPDSAIAPHTVNGDNKADGEPQRGGVAEQIVNVAAAELLNAADEANRKTAQ